MSGFDHLAIPFLLSVFVTAGTIFSAIFTFLKYDNYEIDRSNKTSMLIATIGYLVVLWINFLNSIYFGYVAFRERYFQRFMEQLGLLFPTFKFGADYLINSLGYLRRMFKIGWVRISTSFNLSFFITI